MLSLEVGELYFGERPRSQALLIVLGFLAGLIIPHEGGFAIALVEKIEDIVTILLLPIVRVS